MLRQVEVEVEVGVLLLYTQGAEKGMAKLCQATPPQ